VHLFTDERAVVYRAGPTGYRLARLNPVDQPESDTVAPLTVRDRPAPRLTLPEAVDQLNLTERPFLFFADAADGRGRLLYHRYDGHYGLITPAG
jgi:Sigma 54 modulation/S30EA ribosomal protein C terminus